MNPSSEITNSSIDAGVNCQGNVNECRSERNEEHIYEEYRPRYASYSNDSLSNLEIIFQKLTKRKWLILLAILLPLIGGLVAGLAVHFADPGDSPADDPLNTISTTTTTAVLVLSTRLLDTGVTHNKPMTVDFIGK